MSLYRSSCHVQLPGNFVIVTTLQEQFDDLPLPRT